MFETRYQKVIPRRKYIRRQINSLLVGVAGLAVALFAGVAGYHWIAGEVWVDALLNASMILGGMGPVDALHSDTAKVFASVYALFSGVVFIGVMAIILSPAVHRLMHKFHVEDEDAPKKK